MFSITFVEQIFCIFFFLSILDRILMNSARKFLNKEQKIISFKSTSFFSNTHRVRILTTLNFFLIWVFFNPSLTIPFSIILLLYIPIDMIRLNGRFRRKLDSLDFPKDYIDRTITSKLIFNGGHFISCIYILYQIANS